MALHHMAARTGLLLVCACGSGPSGATSFGDPTTGSATNGTSSTGDGTSDATGASGSSSGSDSDTAGSTGDRPKYDVGAATTTGGGPVDTCKVADDMDGVGDCEQEAPPDSFVPAVQWEFTPDDHPFAVSIPLVANLTDDNGDGEIDLCDTPDVVLTAYDQTDGVAHIYVLDGQTGALHFEIPEDLDWATIPALGDMDGDGLPEILAYSQQELKLFEHDGSLAWSSGDGWDLQILLAAAPALADADNDGDVEIAIRNKLYDHLGNQLHEFPLPLGGGALSATAFADLDGDGDQELILHDGAWHHDGTALWTADLDAAGYPQIANLDGDPEPEVLVQSPDGISILEHDGTFKLQNVKTTDEPWGDPWMRPSTVHDFDGDGAPELAVSSGTTYAVYEPDLTPIWTAQVLDASGDATGTAFDFLGDGSAEAMYADEFELHIYDGAGNPVLTEGRRSITHIEYPVVADVDNDGSAEILVVSNQYGYAEQPAIKVIRDAEDRWIQARRIWNQHTYHVTNVREDGTIPQFEPPSWELLNTYRTNAQIEGGGVCVPPVG